MQHSYDTLLHRRLEVDSLTQRDRILGGRYLTNARNCFIAHAMEIDVREMGK